MNNAVQPPPIPMKVVVFAANPNAVAVINGFYQQGLLAGVVLPPVVDGFNQQLQAWLESQGLPCHRLRSESIDKTAAFLLGIECDLILAFGFMPDFPDELTGIAQYGFYIVLGARVDKYVGAMPFYWQIRQQQKTTEFNLLKLTTADKPDELMVSEVVNIDPHDTLQCLENKFQQLTPILVERLIVSLREHGGQYHGEPISNTGKSAPLVKESDLYVDWHHMNAKQIAALARAGNSALSGCIVVLGNTELNLLQASVVEHPTFGVAPGTICHIGEPEGVLVATEDGAIRLDVLSNVDGVFGAISFVERFGISAGMAFVPQPASAQCSNNKEE